MAWRDIKNKARQTVHDTFTVAGLYFLPNPSAPPAYLPGRMVAVRVHNKFNQLFGDLQGTSFNYAEKRELETQLIFLAAEVPQPKRNAVVRISADEAYRLDNILPRDGLTITADVTPVLASELPSLPTS